MKCSLKLEKRDILVAVSGIAAGAVNGFIGGGGGMLLVPLLKDICGLEAKKALATSVAVLAPLCAVSAAVYFFRGSIELSSVWPYALGGLAGGLAGGLVLKKLRAEMLVRLFGALMIFAGLRILWRQ